MCKFHFSTTLDMIVKYKYIILLSTRDLSNSLEFFHRLVSPTHHFQSYKAWYKNAALA